MALFVDLNGKEFGLLTVVKRSEFKGNGKKPTIHWECICDCGKTTIVSGGSLRSGATKSCGCGMASTQFQFKHGKVGTREYKAWASMKHRIINPDEDHKRNYGDRGIDIDPRWVESFDAFCQDMGDAPSDKHTIERIDNNQGYWPNNCKWATQAEQNRNYRLNRQVTYNGKTQCVTDWAKELGIAKHLIYQRLNRGWDIQRALTSPPNVRE